MSSPYHAYAASKKSVAQQHLKQTLNALDAKAELEWKSGKPPETACWSFPGGVHKIQMYEGLPEYIDNPSMTCLPRGKRKETAYLKAVHFHEVFHGLYTTRKLKELNDLLAKNKLPFVLLNVFEDARIEALGRSRRPGKMHPTHDGTRVESKSYGVRKFDWLRWETLDVSTPINTLLSFIKAEGTNKGGYAPEYKAGMYSAKGCNVDYVHAVFHAAHGGETPWSSKKNGAPIGINYIYRVWRLLAGRNCDTRYPTTESMLGLMLDWESHFPTPEGLRDLPIGPGSDCIQTLEAEGISPYLGEPGSGGGEEKTEPKSDGMKTVTGIHDEKKGDPDESKDVLSPIEVKKRELSSFYFEFDRR